MQLLHFHLPQRHGHRADVPVWMLKPAKAESTITSVLLVSALIVALHIFSRIALS